MLLRLSLVKRTDACTWFELLVNEDFLCLHELSVRKDTKKMYLWTINALLVKKTIWNLVAKKGNPETEDWILKILSDKMNYILT